MSQALQLVLRLVVASLLGAAIGYEREVRAKGAGVRTHVLVALGSALLMIVSQYGFMDPSVAGTHAADASRVAAQIVSGIGFIGAGTIIVQKHAIHGLTTAAGMWVAAGIGMASAGGLYVIAISATVLSLIGLELFGLIHFRRRKGTRAET